MSSRLYAAAAAVAMTILALTVSVPIAAAHVPTGATHPVAAHDGYRGHAMIYGSSTAPAWRWTTTGWAYAPLAPGALGHHEPWGGGWSWFYSTVTQAWYAIPTTRVKQWHCALTQSLGTEWSHQVRVRTQVEMFSTQSATRLSTGTAFIPAGATVTIVCDNTMYDARGGSTPLVSVKLLNATVCLTGTSCTVRPAEGYVPVAALL